jgi:hypothetical protein
VKLVRNQLFWIALVCAAPLVLGTAAYMLDWRPGSESNYGELLAPKPVAGLEGVRGKWALLMFDAPACAEPCEKKLYFMRQVRRAQGKDMDRLERVWALTGAGEPRAAILPGIEGTRVMRLPAEGFPGNPTEHLYVVDPLGNLMMRFPREPDPAKTIKDLQRLLKYGPRTR